LEIAACGTILVRCRSNLPNSLMPRGGQRSGAGRKPIDQELSESVGQACQLEWERIARERALQRYDASPDQKALRDQQARNRELVYGRKIGLAPTELENTEFELHRLARTPDGDGWDKPAPRLVRLQYRQPQSAPGGGSIRERICADVARQFSTIGERISRHTVAKCWTAHRKKLLKNNDFI
jgi:hypothetical protein